MIASDYLNPIQKRSENYCSVEYGVDYLLG